MEGQLHSVPALPDGDAPLDATGQLGLAMSVMRYNQGFVEFLDNKANSLLLVNSIFLAAGAAGDLSSAPGVIATTIAAIAVLACLMVVYARMPSRLSHDPAKLVFFGHIRQRRTADDYLDDFQRTGIDEIAEATILQVHDLATVVEQKFRAYRWAQIVTLFSAAAGIVSLVF